MTHIALKFIGLMQAVRLTYFVHELTFLGSVLRLRN